MNLAPRNKQELLKCMLERVCTHRKQKAVQHVGANLED